MSNKPKSGFWKANQGFATTYEGEPLFVQKGELVRDGHPLLKGREELFDPAEQLSRFDHKGGVEQATAAPGEKRGCRSKPEPEPEPEKKPEPEAKPFGLTTSSLNRPNRSEAD